MKGREQMKKINFRNRYLILLMLPFSILLTFAASQNPFITETIYSSVFYKVTSQILSNITGILPFSLGEFLLICTVVYFIFWLFKTLINIVRNGSKRILIIKHAFLKIFTVISIIYFCFIIMWGLNYHRLPLSEIISLKTEDNLIEDLIAVCENLVEKNNSLRKLIQEDNNGVMHLPNGHRDVFKRAYLGYYEASKLYPILKGNYGRPKGIVFSEIMSHLGISGIYSPFTLEANINVSIPHVLIPFTTCHEIAHQYGFAREDEANFIAYVTCNLHPDKDFQYSGNLLAMTYSMNSLYEYNTDKYREIYNMLDFSVKRDLADISAYWKKYEGPIERASSKVNDTYLKANQQEDGIKSYGRMVDLLIAEYKQKLPVNE